MSLGWTALLVTDKKSASMALVTYLFYICNSNDFFVQNHLMGKIFHPLNISF